MKKLSIELKKFIFNSGFVCSTLIIIACLLAHSIPLWIYARTSPVEYRPSALMFSYSGVFFGGFILVLPLCACGPCAALSYKAKNRSCIEHKDVSFNYNKKESTINILAACIAGAVCIALPCILHTVVWNIIAIPVDPVTYAFHEQSFYGVYNNLYCVMYGLPMYLISMFGMMLCGGLFSMIALITSSWFCEPQAVIGIPSAIYFLWLKMSTIIPDPTALFSDALTSKQLISSLATYAVFYCVLSIFYIFRQRRRQTAHA